MSCAQQGQLRLLLLHSLDEGDSPFPPLWSCHLQFLIWASTRHHFESFLWAPKQNPQGVGRIKNHITNDIVMILQCGQGYQRTRWDPFCACVRLGNPLDHKNEGTVVGCFIFHPIRAHRPDSSLFQRVSMKPVAAGQAKACLISYLKAHAPRFSWSEFLASMLQSFCFTCHSSVRHGLIKCKTRRWLCPLPNAYAWGRHPWAWPCLFCLKPLPTTPPQAATDLISITMN